MRASLLALLIGVAVPGRAVAGMETDLPTPLRLADVMEIARTHRAEVAAARARARAAGERRAIVSALDDPVVTASLDHLPFALHGADASLLVQQGFPLSRIRGNRRRSAEAGFAGARAQAERAVLDVELDAATAFVMLNERRETRRVLEEQRRLASQLRDAAIARYGAGTGIQSEALRAEIEILRFDGLLKAMAADIRAAEAMLNVSLGRPADLPIPSLAAVAAVDSPPSTSTVREAALERRPELRVGRAEIDRSRADISVMRSMYAPMAMVGTGPAYTMADGAGWMFMFGLTVPIWRTRLRAGVAEAQAMTEMAQADLEAMRRMVDGDAVAAREQVEAARARVLILRQEIIPRADQAIAPTLANYAAGKVPLVSVLDAARALWSAQGELVAEEASLGVAWARLQRAMGGRP